MPSASALSTPPREPLKSPPPSKQRSIFKGLSDRVHSLFASAPASPSRARSPIATDESSASVAREEPSGDAVGDANGPQQPLAAAGDGHDSPLSPFTREATPEAEWEENSAVQGMLPDYYDVKRNIPGCSHWSRHEARLHKVLFLREHYAMFQRSWSFYFVGRNIPQSCFAEAGTTKSVPVHAFSNQFAAAKAIEALFDLSAHVDDLKLMNQDGRIGPAVAKTIRAYNKWALKDAGLNRKIHIPTITVHEIVVPTTDADAFQVKYAAATEKMKRLARRHRRNLMLEAFKEQPELAWQYRRRPPVITAFLIFRHNTSILTLDSSRVEAMPVSHVVVRVADKEQWLWNALALALPIHLARNELYGAQETLRQRGKSEPAEDE